MFENQVVEFTVEDVFKALAQDGFEHLRKDWTSYDLEGVITGGCVLSQAGYNLGVDVHSVDGDASWSETSLIGALNQFPVDPDSKWYVEHGGEAAGKAIVYWNDETADNETGWYLPTYQDVIAMAHDILSPHFGKKITLKKMAWSLTKENTDAN